MAYPVILSFTFGNATVSVPFSNLDADLSALAQAVNGLGNGSSVISSAAITAATIGTANVTTLNFTSAIGGNVIINGGTATLANLSLIGPLSSNSGGTGFNSYTDGQLLIGSNLTGGLVQATLSPGPGITILNTPGGITISSGTPNQFRQAVFTSSGTFTANASSIHKITVIGGGGGGGGVSGYSGSLPAVAAGGGGAGAAAIGWANLTTGTAVTVTVGAGGVGGNTTIAGGTGGNSSAVTGSIIISARGGQGGDSWPNPSANTVIASGVGGVAGNSTIAVAGGPGSSGFTGNINAITTTSVSGQGGASLLGFGGSPVICIPTQQLVGKDGGAFGSGGSGAAIYGVSVAVDIKGGNGAAGIVIFEWEA